MTPFEASQPENRDQVMNNIYSNIKQLNNRKNTKNGDRVRIYAYRPKFTKGYMPKWTIEIFVIDEIRKTNPITCKVADVRVVLCNVLCFLTSKYGKIDTETLKMVMSDFYTADLL